MIIEHTPEHGHLDHAPRQRTVDRPLHALQADVTAEVETGHATEVHGTPTIVRR